MKVVWSTLALSAAVLDAQLSPGVWRTDVIMYDRETDSRHGTS